VLENGLVCSSDWDVSSLTTGRGYVKNCSLKIGWNDESSDVPSREADESARRRKEVNPEHVRRSQNAQSQSRWREWILTIAILSGFPSVVSATHEADHRFTVEGYVCGADGKSSANVDVLIKDTKISYGQIVKTDGDGHYRAAFHLHNENLGDPLLIETNGQQQQQKVSFDPKDLESERIIQVNFGTGCLQDKGSAPLWVYLGAGGVVAAIGGFIGLKLIRSSRKQEQKRGKSQSKRSK
jgi:hypothetical protein